jgi:hypothetical protein
MASDTESNAAYVSAVQADYEKLDSAVKDSIQELITAAGETMSATFDLSDIVTSFSVPDWSIQEPPSVPTPSRGDLPIDWQGLNIPAFVFNPEDYISADMLTKHTYSSDFFNNFLDERLRSYIDSQSYFLAMEVQDALFEASRQRDLQTLNDALDAADRLQARRGFPIPTSMLTAARNEVIRQYQNTAADRNKEITALIADKSLQEKQHAMDIAIRMEDIRSRFQLEYAKIYWQAADYLVKKYQMDVSAEIARISAEMQMIGLVNDTNKRNVEFELEEETLKNQKNMARLQAEMQEMTKQVEMWVETYKSRIQAAGETVDYYKGAVLGKLGSYTAIDYVDKKA